MQRYEQNETACRGTAADLHFNYDLQVWVKGGVCQNVGAGRDRYAGMMEQDAIRLAR